MNRVSTLLLLAACTTSACIDPAPRTASVASALTEVTSFGTNPGMLRMYTSTPTGIPSGPRRSSSRCTAARRRRRTTSTPAGTISPTSPSSTSSTPSRRSSNNAEDCFDGPTTSSDISRGAGEGVFHQADGRHHEEPRCRSTGSRVFVTGLSAGGAMTPVMLATCTDVFAAGAVMSGFP